MIGRQIFLDTSAFVGLYLKDDEFHKEAIEFLTLLAHEKIDFVTTNFILDETYTFLKVRAGKSKAIKFRDFLRNMESPLRVRRIFSADERDAWKYFDDIPGRGVSFTDCTSFAVMKHLGLKEAFTFDRDFVKAGFRVVP